MADSPEASRFSDENPESPTQIERPGRLRAAWSVLRGERLVPLQIQAEWADYQRTFGELLTRFSAQLARQAKAERKRVRDLLQEQEAAALQSPQHDSPSSSDRLDLWRRASQRGLAAQPPQPVHRHHPPEEA